MSGATIHPTTVLVISADADLCRTIRVHLEGAPDITLVGLAESGAAGLEQAQALRPAVGLLHAGLPDNSLEIAARLKARLPELRIVMMNRVSDPDWMRCALLAGANAFLNLPILDAAHVRDTIRYALTERLVSPPAVYTLPYGKNQLGFSLPGGWEVHTIAPRDIPAPPDALRRVQAALDHPVGAVKLRDFVGARSAAVAINDKTRPVPHEMLLPPLLDRLEALGIAPDAITLIIATGTHPPMPPGEFERVVPPAVRDRCRIICHDCDDQQALVHLGSTPRGTPVWVNRHYLAADLRLVVGNIEPHQFMGFSGGVKSAAIGLAGRATINANHAHMTDPLAQLSRYDDNPARQDVEDIGRLIGVHFALNAVLNRDKQILHALAGDPVAVMEAGIPLVTGLATIPIGQPFDLVIASPGGYPKDINLYQAQKGLAHAALITRDGGTIILAAACSEGTGSRSYEQWMAGVDSLPAVFERFTREGFRVGPHKAFQIARDASRVRVFLVSDLAPDFVRKLLLTPAALDDALAQALADLPPGGRIGILPLANATVPALATAE